MRMEGRFYGGGLGERNQAAASHKSSGAPETKKEEAFVCSSQDFALDA